MEYTKEEYIEMYDNLSFARQYFYLFEEYGLKGVLPGFFHLRLGAEAVPMALHMELKPEDWHAYYISSAPALAKKIGLKKYLPELFAKPQGIDGGLGGESHVYDPEARIGPLSGFLGTTPAVALGFALNMQMDNEPGCVVSVLGDGTLNEGPVSEALNIAATWKLPIVYIIENNGIAESTLTENAFAIEHLSQRGKGFGIESSTHDGTDIIEVRRVLREAMEKARNNEPQLIEFKTSRWLGHFLGDPDVNRDKNDIKAMKILKDPIKWNRDYLIGMRLATKEELDAIDKKNESEIREAIEWALELPEKTEEQVKRPVFAEND